MGFLEVFVRRPVFTTMVIATMVVLGLASFVQLGVDIFPKVDLPTITITTLLPGASPEEIESQITKPIEEVVNTISGLDELRSSTIEGQSQVFATFVLERNVQEAANDVREKVGTVLSRLPAGTESPIVEKVDPDSAPVMALVVSGQRSAREITEIADKRIKRALETVKDVGAITLVGDRKREIQILVNPDKLSAFGLSIQQVKDALLRQNVEIPGGRLTAGGNEEGLRTLGRIESVAAFEDLIVADAKGSPVRARDVATIRDAEEEPRTLSRLNGDNAVSLLVRKQSGTNTVAVVDRIKARLTEVQKGLPQDIQFEIVRDLSRFIKRSFHEVQDHLLLGGLLASLIVAFFIGRLLWYESLVLVAIIAAVSAAFLQGDPEFLLKVTGVCIVVTMVFFFSVKKLRPAFVAALAIPVSIIATFTAMRMAGFTLNNLTMLGLSLSTGIVIDDAIIVLENIFRHTEEERRPPFEAAITGTREISLAVTATTVSLVVIFLPVAFMGGLVGKFWNSFGLTAAFAIMVSLVVAFTLTPMLAARIFSGMGAGGAAGAAAHRDLQVRLLPPAGGRLRDGARLVPAASRDLLPRPGRHHGGRLVPHHLLQARVRGGRRHERVRGGGGGAAGLLHRAERDPQPRHGGGDPEGARGVHALHHHRGARPVPVQRHRHLDLRGAQASLAAEADPARAHERRAPAAGRVPRDARQRAEHQPDQRRRLPADAVQPHPARTRARAARAPRPGCHRRAEDQARLRGSRHRPVPPPARGAGADRPQQGLRPRACGWTRWPPRCGPWWAGRRSASTGKPANSTTSGSASTRGTGRTPPACPPSWCRRATARWSSSPT